MSRTIPQIIMLNHAAGVNAKRMDLRVKDKHKNTDNEEDPIVWKGKRLSQMNSDEWELYYGGEV